MDSLKRRPNDAEGGTGPIVPAGSHTDICRAPVCHQLRAIVLANTRSSATDGATSQQDDLGNNSKDITEGERNKYEGVDEGVYGVSFGRSALSPSCSNNGAGGGAFDMFGYEELTSALGSEARQEIDQSSRIALYSAAGGGDETR